MCKKYLIVKGDTLEQIITICFLFMSTCSCESAGEVAYVFHVCPSAWKYSAPPHTMDFRDFLYLWINNIS